MQPVTNNLRHLQDLGNSLDRLGVDEQGRIFKHKEKPATLCDQDALEKALMVLINEAMFDLDGSDDVLNHAVAKLKMPSVTKWYKEASACYSLNVLSSDSIYQFLPTSFPFARDHDILVKYDSTTEKTMALFLNRIKGSSIEIPVDGRSNVMVNGDLLKADHAALKDMETRLKEILGKDHYILWPEKNAKGKYEFVFYRDRPLLVEELKKSGYVVELPIYGNFDLVAAVYTGDGVGMIKSEPVAFDKLAEHVGKIAKKS